MGKAASRKPTTTAETDPTEEYFAAIEAKQRFLGSVLNMGWRLALTFLVPVIAGAWLDKRFDTAPSYTITGLFLAIAGAVMVVRSTVRDVNAESAELEKQAKKKVTRAKRV